MPPGMECGHGQLIIFFFYAPSRCLADALNQSFTLCLCSLRRRNNKNEGKDARMAWGGRGARSRAGRVLIDPRTWGTHEACPGRTNARRASSGLFSLCCCVRKVLLPWSVLYPVRCRSPGVGERSAREAGKGYARPARANACRTRMQSRERGLHASSAYRGRKEEKQTKGSKGTARFRRTSSA